MRRRGSRYGLLSWAVLLVLLLGACSWSGSGEPPITDDTAPPSESSGSAEPGSPGPPGNSEQDPDQKDGETEIPADEWADEIEAVLGEMTPAEKIGQLIMIGVAGQELDETIQTFIAERRVGGVILYSRNLKSVEQSVRLINDLKQVSQGAGNQPLFISIDEEGGSVTRLPDPIVTAPSARRIGAEQSSELAYDVGSLIGVQVSAFGINMNFAPVLDIDSNPNNPVIGSRAYDSGADMVSELGISVMQGLAQHVVPVVKHFPGHGDTSVDSHLQLPVIEHDAERLRSIELVPFTEAIAAGADAVMVGHLLVPAFDEVYPATLSHSIMTNLLRQELGFDGLIVTDDMTMGAILEHYDFGEAVVRSVLAGSDLVLIGHQYELASAALEALEDAYVSGELTEERIDESVRRILLLKQRYALSDDLVTEVNVASLNERAEEVLAPLR